ncbi:MAG: hypothetical protein KA144_04820 [Xanthomonadaceae bacterium]|nr:hypothetical protein [Xanthomonadaceae bacterium]
MTLFVIGIVACFLFGDILRRFGATAEVSRKSVHVTTCTMIAAFPLFDIGYRELMLIAGGSFLSIALLRTTVLMRSIMAVERTSYGDLLLPLSLVIATWMDFSYPAFLAAYLVLGFSDTLASLVGGAYGRRRYTLLGHTKSHVGSAAFFFSAFAIIAAVAMYAGGPIPIPTALLIGVAVGALLTLVEAFSHKGTDNLFVPLIAATVLNLWLPA